MEWIHRLVGTQGIRNKKAGTHGLLLRTWTTGVNDKQPCKFCACIACAKFMDAARPCAGLGLYLNIFVYHCTTTLHLCTCLHIFTHGLHISWHICRSCQNQSTSLHIWTSLLIFVHGLYISPHLSMWGAPRVYKYLRICPIGCPFHATSSSVGPSASIRSKRLTQTNERANERFERFERFLRGQTSRLTQTKSPRIITSATNREQIWSE